MLLTLPTLLNGCRETHNAVSEICQVEVCGLLHCRWWYWKLMFYKDHKPKRRAGNTSSTHIQIDDGIAHFNLIRFVCLKSRTRLSLIFMKTAVRVVANNTDIVLLFCTIEMKKMLIYINIYIYIYIYIYMVSNWSMS